ncbi:hypothetical protein [Mucilaginibacter terrae]|uniref:Outer membrane protein beta-barrel domain-containing protein n=1 Tax=Mucilaginibacter terrae TaxID=1955052 RepID=A0ABU3GVT9_9SPHI|nr:hypothetical protein [Mucilaginibacter terrae]MDT3403087.1 hypothetical protein [Mucilaginibacter terrae]
MKKTFLLFAIALTFSATKTFAQNYNTALGVGVDFGTGTTLVGPSIKHFFSRNDAIQADVLFSKGYTWIGAYYEYQESFRYAKQLQWYLGLGPQVALTDDRSVWFLRPTAGLDYKVAGAPISLAIDWRPRVRLSDGGSNFQAGRFGFGFRFAF